MLPPWASRTELAIHQQTLRIAAFIAAACPEAGCNRRLVLRLPESLRGCEKFGTQLVSSAPRAGLFGFLVNRELNIAGVRHFWAIAALGSLGQWFAECQKGRNGLCLWLGDGWLLAGRDIGVIRQA